MRPKGSTQSSTPVCEIEITSLVPVVGCTPLPKSTRGLGELPSLYQNVRPLVYENSRLMSLRGVHRIKGHASAGIETLDQFPNLQVCLHPVLASWGGLTLRQCYSSSVTEMGREDSGAASCSDSTQCPTFVSPTQVAGGGGIVRQGAERLCHVR